MAMLLHLKNLSVLAATIDVRRFFTHYDILENGVHILEGPDPEAFIKFRHYSDLLNAVSLTGHDLLGQAVKLYIISFSEMEQIIERRNATIMGTTQMIGSAPMISTSGANRDHTSYLNRYFDSVAMSNQDYIGHTRQTNLGGRTYNRNEGMDRDCLQNLGQHARYETDRESRQIGLEIARDRWDNGQYGMVVGYKEDRDNQMASQRQQGIVDSVPGYIRLDNLPASIGHPELEDLFKYYKMRIAMPDGIIRNQGHGDNSAFIKLSSHDDALRADALNELEMQGHKVHVRMISAHQYDKVNFDMMQKKDEQDTLYTDFDYITFEANRDAAFKAAGGKQKWNDRDTFRGLGEVVEPHCNIKEYTTPRKIQNFTQGEVAMLSQTPSSGSNANIYKTVSDHESIFSRLILGAKSSDAKMLSFIRLSSDAVSDGATASGMCRWLSEKNATNKGVILVRTSMGATVCAFIAFESMAHCKRALQMCPGGWIRTQEKICCLILRYGSEYDIFESTPMGNDIKVSKERRKELQKLSLLQVEENQAQGKKGKAQSMIRKNQDSNLDGKNKSQGQLDSGILSKSIIFSNLVERANAIPGDSKYLCFMRTANMSPDATPWSLWKQYGGTGGNCKGVVVVRTRDANNAWRTVYAYMAFEDPVHRNAALKVAGLGRKWNSKATFQYLAQVGADCAIMQSTTPGTDHELSKIERALLSQTFHVENKREFNAEVINKDLRNASNAGNPKKASSQQSIVSQLTLPAESPDEHQQSSFIGASSIEGTETKRQTFTDSSTIASHDNTEYFIKFDQLVDDTTACGMWDRFGGPHGLSKGVRLVRSVDNGKALFAYVAFGNMQHRNAAMVKNGPCKPVSANKTYRHLAKVGPLFRIFESTMAGTDREMLEGQITHLTQKSHAVPSVVSFSKSVIFSDLVECANAKPGNSKFVCFMRVSDVSAKARPWSLWKRYGGTSGSCKGVILVRRRDDYHAWCAMFAYIAFGDHGHRNAALKAAGLKVKWSAMETFQQLAQVEADCNIIRCTTPGENHELSKDERALLRQTFHVEKNKESNAEVIPKESSNGSNAENPEKASDEQSIFSRLIANAESPDSKPLYFILISSDAIPEGATASGMCRWLSRPNATSKGAILVYTSMGDRECAFIAYESKVDCMAALEECEGGRMRSGSSTSRAIALYGSEYDIFESTEMGNDNKISEERRKELRQLTPSELNENQAQGKIDNKTTRPQRLNTDHEKSRLEDQIVTIEKIESSTQEALPTKISDGANYSSLVHVKICNLSLSVKFQDLRTFFQKFALVSAKNGIIFKVGQHSKAAYVKFNSLPDGLKIDSLDCSMLKGEGVIIEMITSDMFEQKLFEHEQSKWIEGAETQPRSFTDLNSGIAPHDNFEWFIKFDNLADDTTACAIWERFGGSQGLSKGVRLVRRVDDRDDIPAFVAFAYVAFDNADNRNSAVAKNKHCKAVSATKSYRHLANLGPMFKIFEATQTGRDQELPDGHFSQHRQKHYADLRQKHHADSVNLNQSAIFSYLAERADAKPGSSKYLCFMYVSNLAPNVSPWELWKQYGGATEKCKGVVMVQKRDDHNAWYGTFAYLAFGTRMHRNAALKAAGLWTKWSARVTFQHLAQVNADYNIIECTTPGKVRSLSKGERAILCQTFPAEQNKESNAEIITKESSNRSNAKNPEKASSQQSIFSRLIADAKSPDAKSLYFIFVSSDAIPEGATASGMCSWLSGPNATSKGAILVRTSMGGAECAFIAFETKLHCKAALEECEGGWMRTSGSTRRVIVRYGSDYEIFESTEIGNDIKVSEERWKELQQVTPLEFEQNQAQGIKRKAQDSNIDETIDKKIKVEYKILNQDKEEIENQEAEQSPNSKAVSMNEDGATVP